MEDAKYYYNRDGRNNGPVSLEELKELAMKGEINGKTPVIKVGTKEWVKWEALASASAGQGVHPAAGASAPKPVMKAVVLQPAEQEVERQGLGSKITQVYERINDFLTRACVLPTGLADTPEQCERSLNFLNAPVGVGTLLCVVCLILGNSIYENITLTAGLLLAGCVVQYICYQLYRVMTPLLLGRKIKLSSMGVPWAVMMISLLLALKYLREIFLEDGVSGVMGDIMLVLFYAGVSYVCVNAQKLFVTVVPRDVTPGRELVNYARFTLRALFMALHVLTPLLMLISALTLLTGDIAGMRIVFSFVRALNDFNIMRLLNNTIEVAGGILPIVTLFLFCVFSLLLDIVEAIFAAGDAKDKTSE